MSGLKGLFITMSNGQESNNGHVVIPYKTNFRRFPF